MEFLSNLPLWGLNIIASLNLVGWGRESVSKVEYVQEDLSQISGRENALAVKPVAFFVGNWSRLLFHA